VDILKTKTLGHIFSTIPRQLNNEKVDVVELKHKLAKS